MLNQYHEPELVGDDLEDAQIQPEAAHLLWIVEVINSNLSAPTVRLVEVTED